MIHTYFWGSTINYSVFGLSIFAIVLIWTLVWKVFALWYAARDGRPWWFTAMLFINTLGLLEILYIFVIRKRASCHCDKCGCNCISFEPVVDDKIKHTHNKKIAEATE